ncbi:MAG: hybrid sensor histidine kinase/response regulator [Bacteroidota bacterium]
MSAKNKVIFYAVLLAIAFYFIDSLIYYLVFAEGNSFIQILITAVPLNEIYNRLLLFVGIILLGFISSAIISNIALENEFLRNQPPKRSAVDDSSFIAGLSYQIRTPLNAIVGFSELLKDPNLSLQSKQTYINHIHASGNYLLQLINNLSDITRIESKQMTVTRSETRINIMLDELLAEFEQQKKEMGKSDIKLDVVKGNNDPQYTIFTDPDRLKQVLTNLLENALKHTEEGKVEFGYKIKEKNLMEFHVKDTGKGFSMARLETIFNRFNKLTDNRNQPFDTVALRLTISKSLVKLLGGNIWATSRLGRGSTFLFTLPFTDVENPETEPEKAKTPAPPKTAEVHNWENRTILIAEDVESNFIYLQELLKPSDAKLIWARNGKEAVGYVKSNKDIDLVLMDILMPEMDGYEATKEIKKMRPELPVIAQTAYSLEGSENKDDVKRFDDFLIKPIWSPQLMEAIGKHF